MARLSCCVAQEFTFSDGALCSKNGHCLTVKQTDPTGGGGGGVDAVQIWAKPQPKGATAVLLINDHAGDIPISFDFADVRPVAAGRHAAARASDHAGLGGRPLGRCALSRCPRRVIHSPPASPRCHRFDPGSAGTTVLDVWTGFTKTLAAGTTSFESDVVGEHDSRFYLLSPAA